MRNRSENLLKYAAPEASPRYTHYLFRYPAKFHPPVAQALLERYTEPSDCGLDRMSTGAGSAQSRRRRSARRSSASSRKLTGTATASRSAQKDGIRFWKLPLPFHYISIGIETVFTSQLDPIRGPPRNPLAG